MTERLLVAVLGNRNSGKTRTWKTLFGHKVRTGNTLRRLFLSDTEYVDVFLISGSPQERQKRIEDIIPTPLPRIVLCSVQYRRDAVEIFDYLMNWYHIYAHWLNPGRWDNSKTIQPDSLGVATHLLYQGVTIAIRNGKEDPKPRVEDLREIIYGWAWNNRLIRQI
jgi:hypothetical protein